MRQSQVARQQTRQKADFRLIASNQMLQRGSASLRQVIEEELNVNPALELATDLLCPSCGFPLRKGECRFCSELFFVSQQPGEEKQQPEISAIFPRLEKLTTEKPEVGEMEAPISLAEHLSAQAQAALPAADHAIANYLIANIGNRGFLECDLDEVCQELKTPLARVERVLAVLQGLDPAGVGAKNPQEALLIQARQLAKEKEIDPWAEKIIRLCWEDLAYHRYGRIARFLGCTEEQVINAVAFIRDNLNPYPASAFAGCAQTAAEQTVRWPDLIIHRDKDDYWVEVVESYESELRVSETFLRLRQTLSGNGQASKDSAAALESLRRACFFLSCLKMRKRTLEDVAGCVIRLQRGYLDTGLEEHLRPLTRAKVGGLLGKHESTISRAVADKLVLLPDRQLVTFDKFFTRAAGPKSIIRELVQRELRGKPLTDKQITRILASRGYAIARRTVTKYRLALQIPPSTQRRRRNT